MEVQILKQEFVDFTLPSEKCETLSHKTFRMLTNFECKPEINNKPKMVWFKSKKEYMENICKYDVDLDQDMLITPKGHIYCYLKGSSVSIGEETDGSTNTEENTDE